MQASASRDGGTAKSSVISVVPDGREPPTAVTNAFRAFQYPAMTPASRVNSLLTDATGATSSSPASTSRAASSCAARAASSGARNSTSSAVVVFGSSAQSAGTPDTLTEARSVLPSISSTAIAPASLNSGTAAAAALRVGKNSRAVEVYRFRGSVSKTVSAMKPRVPSEPTVSPRRISTGVAPSRKASSR